MKGKHFIGKLIHIERHFLRALVWHIPLIVVYEAIVQLSMATILWMKQPRSLLTEKTAVDDYTDVSSYVFGVLVIVI
jgi:hypothetical protein